MHDDHTQTLLSRGLLEQEGDSLRTTRKWQSAMARASLHLYQQGDDGDDLRVPIARALIELCGDSMDDEELAHCVAAMLPIEARALGLVPPS